MVHLVSNVLIEALLFLSDNLSLCLIRSFILLNSFKVLLYDSLVEVLLLSDLILMTLQGLLPSVTLSRVVILDDAMVLVRANIATIMKLLDLTGHKWRIPHETVPTQVDMAVQGRIH